MSESRRIPVLEELFRARLRAVVDPRTTPCVVRLVPSAKGIAVEGLALNAHVATAIRNLATEIYEGRTLNFSKLRLLSTRPVSFVRVGWEPAPFFRSPRVDVPDQLTTALPGCFLRVFLRDGEFLYVQHPDGYVGYIESHLAMPAPKSAYLNWRNRPVAYVPNRFSLASGHDIPAGTRLALRRDGRLILPDGTTADAPESCIEMRDPAENGGRIIRAVERLLPEYTGTPYHWGGKTDAGTDCSGFVQTVAGAAGISLPRDASMQCHVGEIVGILPKQEDLLPGDILFFMNDRGFVYHVGIYLGNHRFVHSSRQFGGVVFSSLVPGGERHSAQYATDFCYARRVGCL